ncbi:uncharacterized protein BDZ83DRAFT_80041 [Colletotrichum acutatum]|uniref:Zn(2)-C6 fungal-type domain-containing protein n=1 Tax=Glomerella acutata TaxID=27357 RepID=A0AAD8XDF2_GLOAC|nr:uncharacterized protein BDZ83DRAFT_80041 [Colletotrichum acutatum]KAK1713444.1 hypothetical protein BDZ83DRAFT_80041 [Colletotrichum acutatum]
MSSRRSHVNSHHCCLQRNEGRVKCDEGKPVCSRCRKRGLKCVYRHLLESQDTFSNFSLQQGRPGESRAFGVGYFRGIFLPHTPTPKWPGSDPAADFLLGHYFGYLAVFLVSPPSQFGVLSMYQQAIERHLKAQKSCIQLFLPFLQHTFQPRKDMSGSNSRPRMPVSKCLITGLHHRALALESFRSAHVGNLTPPTCKTALMAVGLLIACSFALSPFRWLIRRGCPEPHGSSNSGRSTVPRGRHAFPPGLERSQ